MLDANAPDWPVFAILSVYDANAPDWPVFAISSVYDANAPDWPVFAPGLSLPPCMPAARRFEALCYMCSRPFISLNRTNVL